MSLKRFRPHQNNFHLATAYITKNIAFGADTQSLRAYLKFSGFILRSSTKESKRQRQGGTCPPPHPLLRIVMNTCYLTSCTIPGTFPRKRGVITFTRIRAGNIPEDAGLFPVKYEHDDWEI
jgi:hypothetical protein